MIVEEITYRPLALDECEQIRQIDASQYIARAWRKVEGALRLVNIDYLDPDFPEGIEQHICRLRTTIEQGGAAIGAFRSDGLLVGFATLNSPPFGVRHRYALMDQLFISQAFRRRGIGRKLLLYMASEARVRNVQKLYICAASAEETIAFYRSVGCVDALEINDALANADLRDIQLEFSVTSI